MPNRRRSRSRSPRRYRRHGRGRERHRRNRSISRSRSNSRSLSSSSSKSRSHSSSLSRSRSNSPSIKRKRSYKSRYDRSRSRHRSPKRSSRRSDGSSQRKKEKEYMNDNENEKKKETKEENKNEEEEKGPIKAQVSEVNGEISCSIEETNRIRISLGLKPLNLEKKKENIVELTKTKEDLEEETQQMEIRERIRRSKLKRELHAKEEGKSLGEILKEENKNESILDWVNKSRTNEKLIQIQNKKQQAIEKKLKLLNEQDALDEYNSKNLSGITLAHDLETFEEGEQVILTIKDTSVIANDGTNLNEDEIELENVNVAEATRRKHRQEEAKRALKPVYTGYDDDEFTTPGQPSKPKLLSQYDDINDKKKKEKLKLNESGEIQIKDIEKEKEMEEKLKALKEKNKQLTNLITSKRTIDEYYTKEEMIQFNQLKKGKKLKKKKKRRPKTKDIIEELEEIKAKEDSNQMEKNMNMEIETFSKNSNSNSKNSVSKRHNIKEKEEDDDDDEADDMSLQESILRARRISHQKQQLSSNLSIETIAKQIEESKNSTNRMNIDQEKKFIYTDSTNFEVQLNNALQFKLEQKQEDSHHNNPKLQEKKRKQDKDITMEDIEIKKKSNMMMETVKEDEDENEDNEWGQDQPLVANGMGATLSMLRSSGNLNQSIQRREAGRANDVRDYDDLIVRDGVKLEYRDEYGRNLTKKEAFRQLSYRFHGQKPGKKKEERRLKQLKEELEMEKQLSGEGASATMRVLENRQRVTGQAHVVLSGGSNLKTIKSKRY